MPLPRPLAAVLRRHAQARRLRMLDRSPERATWPEVEELLSRELPLRAVLDVCVRAHARSIRTGVLWAWARRHGAPLLALAVAAGLDEADLCRYFTTGQDLDVESLELHAELNGSPVAAVRVGTGLAPWY